MGDRTYPGGSKSRVNAAGRRVRAQATTVEDLAVIDTWRAAHRDVLNTFQAILRNRTRGRDIFVAQRLKRKVTLFDKLIRLPSMELARMDDIAGCRLIFSSINDLYEFRSVFHRAKFKHRLRNSPSKYDYIQRPKSDGYRGIHDIYEYNVNSRTNSHLAGLNIEIQYRTRLQHAWATAVEVLGNVTDSSPKFKRGDPRLARAMALGSEILSRAYEGLKGPFPDFGNRKVVTDFIDLDDEIGLREVLRGLSKEPSPRTNDRSAKILMRSPHNLQVYNYRDIREALQVLFRMEREFPHEDIVLVRSESDAETAFAFSNYFNNAEDFLRLMDQGIVTLTNRKFRWSNLGDDWRVLGFEEIFDEDIDTV